MHFTEYKRKYKFEHNFVSKSKIQTVKICFLCRLKCDACAPFKRIRSKPTTFCFTTMLDIFIEKWKTLLSQSWLRLPFSQQIERYREKKRIKFKQNCKKMWNKTKRKKFDGNGKKVQQYTFHSTQTVQHCLLHNGFDPTLFSFNIALTFFVMLLDGMNLQSYESFFSRFRSLCWFFFCFSLFSSCALCKLKLLSTLHFILILFENIFLLSTQFCFYIRCFFWLRFLLYFAVVCCTLMVIVYFI